MGLISNLKNKFNANKQNENRNIPSRYEGIQQANLTIQRKDGTEVIFYPKGVKWNITHSNGEMTKLVTGKIDIVRPDDTIFVDSGAPVCFEIPRDMSIEQAIQSGFLASLDYNGHFDNLNYNQYNVLGRLVMQNNNANIIPFTNAVSQKVQELNQELIQEREQKNLEIQRKQQLRREEEERHMQQVFAREKQEMEQRRENPSFVVRNQKRDHNNQILYSYQTVDRNTGKEIILGNVRKLAKDSRSNYVYEGRMQLLNNQVYHMPDELGYAVIFSSAYKLEQIAETQTPELVDRISRLLTVNNLQDDKMAYLGQLDIEGNITRQLEQTLPEMQDYIRKTQRQYESQTER